MKSISLKLKEQILNDTEQILVHLKSSRKKYINEAVNVYKEHQKKEAYRRTVKERIKNSGRRFDERIT